MSNIFISGSGLIKVCSISSCSYKLALFKNYVDTKVIKSRKKKNGTNYDDNCHSALSVLSLYQSGGELQFAGNSRYTLPQVESFRSK